MKMASETNRAITDVTVTTAHIHSKYVYQTHKVKDTIGWKINMTD